MAVDNKRVFEVETADGKKLKLAVLRPTFGQQQAGERIYASAFSKNAQAGAILRVKVKALLKEQNLWSDEKEAEEKAIRQRIDDNERKLLRGGFKLAEGRKIAFQLWDDRATLLSLTREMMALDNLTAEGRADDERFHYYVSICTVHADTGKPYFSSYDDYRSRASDPVAERAALELMTLLYSVDPNYEKSKVENKFLLKYGFVNDKLELVDDKKRRVDREGRLVDEFGRFVNENGELVDNRGNRVDKDGQPIEEFLGFLDDDGRPIVETAATTPAPKEPGVSA